MQIAIGFPGVAPDDPDRAALHVAALALRDATLHDLRLVEGATYTTSVFESVRRGPAPIVFQTAVDPERVVPAVQDIWRAVDQLHAGLSDEETARFRERAIALFPSRFDTVATTVAQLAIIAALDLAPGSPAAELDAIGRVTAADVKRVAEKYMTDQTLQLVMLGDLSAIKPAQDMLVYRPATASAP